MIVVDVNGLVAAFVTGHEFHESGLRTQRRALTDLSPALIPDVVWSGFVRFEGLKTVVPEAA
ncbi:MAG: hypothetical protein LBG11_10830 [Bifidobacteriaceae bacterium]|nr:hypothetical protein [Bifidobacteriaceae bacterium]